jgi:hypothetical protein
MEAESRRCSSLLDRASCAANASLVNTASADYMVKLLVVAAATAVSFATAA